MGTRKAMQFKAVSSIYYRIGTGLRTLLCMNFPMPPSLHRRKLRCIETRRPKNEVRIQYLHNDYL